MTIRAALLTWRMHRFEVLFSAGALAAFAAWVWMVSQQMLDLDIPGTCWPRDESGRYASPGCDALMETFWRYQSESGYPRVGMNLLAPVVGLLLGVPVVAREIELRTTELAWSLALRRSRWLLARLVPMLAVALVGFIILGWLGDRLFAALAVGRQGPDLTEVAAHGPALVARGLMALGIGLLAGAVVGRTLPALVVGAVCVLAWGLVAVPTVQRSMFADRAVWESEAQATWREGYWDIATLDHGMFDPSRPGVNGEPGARVAEETEWPGLVEAACGPYPEEWDEGYEDCNLRLANSVQWSLVVPASSYGHFQAVESALGLAIGGLALLVAFPVVSRRRPI